MTVLACTTYLEGVEPPARSNAATPRPPNTATSESEVTGRVWRFDWRNGVDSPYEQPHRKDLQVVRDREEALTTLTPQTA